MYLDYTRYYMIAAVAVRAHKGKNSSYCYTIGRGPNSCLLGQVPGLLFCLHKETFLPFTYNSDNL